jgi:hypothetical protein
MVNDKLKSAALLRCGICEWRDVKWRCLDETCPGFADFKFYDPCTSGIHGEHEHLVMTPEDRADAMRYFAARREEVVVENTPRSHCGKPPD